MTELPRGWRRLALADLGTWYGGGTPSKARSDFWSDGTVPWLSPKDMGQDVIRSTQDLITEAAVGGSAVRRVPAGSVALVVRSGILERTLPIAVVPIDVTLNQDMKALVPRSDVDARWVAWGLRSREQALLRACRKTGTTVASIETKRLLAEELPVPPLDEQRRIVEILEDHLSRLDAATRDIATGTERLVSLRASVLADQTRGEPNVALGTVAKLKSGFAYPSSGWTDSGVPVVKIANVRNGRVDLGGCSFIDEAAASHSSEFAVRRDDLLITLTGEIGAVGVYAHDLEARLNQRVGRIDIFRSDLLDTRFLRYVLEAPSARRSMWAGAKGMAQPNISPRQVERLEIPLPPIRDQVRVVRALENHFSCLDSAFRLVAPTVSRTASLRRSLLQAAFTGELTAQR